MMKVCPIAYWKKHRPDRLAFPSLSYEEFDGLIQKACAHLSSFKEQIFCFAPQNNPVSIALFFAGWRLKKAVYPINPRLPTRDIQERLKKTNGVWIKQEEIIFNEKKVIVNTDPNHLATLIDTSSASKIVCHSLNSHIISAESAIKALNLSSESIYCLNLPLFHVSGIATFMRTFIAGGQLTFRDQKNSATHISMVPTQLYRSLKEQTQFPNLQCLLMGGAPLADTLYHKALKQNFPLYTSYGMTETASMVIVKPPNEKTCLLPHVKLKIAEDGEILLKGPSIFSHYWGMEKRAEWFATKDLGSINKEGEIVIIGRKDRQFISGGENIQPEEIEKVLMQIDPIMSARITPIEDPEFGMRPAAKIYATHPLSQETIKEKLKKILPTYKIPVQMEILLHEEEVKFSLE